MPYSPNQVCVYLAAFQGALAGFGAAGQYLSEPSVADYTLQAAMADAFAQAVDTAWGHAGFGTPTGFEEAAIQENAEAVWENRSPLPTNRATIPGNYFGLANGVIALSKAGNARVVAQGVDPNACEGGGGGGNVTGTAPITSTGGPNAVIGITPATESAAGSMSAADKTKLDGLPVLVSTDDGFAAGPIGPLTNVSDTVIVSSDPVVVAAGEKVLVWTSVEYDAGAGNGTAQRVQQAIASNLAGVIDTANHYVQSSGVTGLTPSPQVLARARKFSGLAAGTHTFSVLAAVSSAGSPAVNASNASIVVLVSKV